MIKDYFLNYNEALVNDFILESDGSIQLLKSDIQGWKISFVHTGLKANIGQRLRAVREHIGDDEYFLANYSDALTDAPLPEIISTMQQRNTIATFLCVQPNQSFHFVSLKENDLVADIQDVKRANVCRDIFDYLGPGEELVEAPFHRLIAQEQLLAHRYEGFWAPMDTLKDRDNLQTLFEGGQPPWAIWEQRERADAELLVR